MYTNIVFLLLMQLTFISGGSNKYVKDVVSLFYYCTGSSVNNTSFVLTWLRRFVYFITTATYTFYLIYAVISLIVMKVSCLLFPSDSDCDDSTEELITQLKQHSDRLRTSFKNSIAMQGLFFFHSLSIGHSN